MDGWLEQILIPVQQSINLEFKDSLNNKTNFTTENLGTC
jgi:hypothetical protein